MSRLNRPLYALLVTVLLGSLLFVGGTSSAEDASCYAITGAGVDMDNTGSLSPDDGSVPCADDAGSLSGVLVSDNIGKVILDHGSGDYDEARVDVSTGEFSGYAYAPLNAYDSTSEYGIWFDLEGVVVDLATGDVSGEAYSESLGDMSFEGLSLELTPVELSIDFEVDVGVSADIRDDGYPLADGTSPHVIYVWVDFSEIEGVTRDYVEDNVSFDADVNATGDVRFDQLFNTGSANDAINPMDDYFELWQFEDFTSKALYAYRIASYAPTSNTGCAYVDDGVLEFCATGGDEYTYNIDSLDITLEVPRNFTLTGSGLDEESELVGAAYQVEANLTIDQQLSWAPWYEVDNFTIDTQVDDWGDVPELALDEKYKFVGEIVNNSGFSSDNMGWGVNFTVSDDFDYWFGEADCVGSTMYHEVLGGDFEGDINTKGELCEQIEGMFADIGDLIAYGSSYFTVEHEMGGVAKYYSEYFGLGAWADARADMADPRIWVIGTVSGLAEGDDVTVVGNVGIMELRDVVFEQVMKIIRGISSSYLGYGGVVEDDWTIYSGGEYLVSDSVLYFTGGSGDVVTIKGGAIDDITKTILVVGADVYVKNNIYRTGEDGELGIIVLADEGVGGNMYVEDQVTDLHANIFLDGSLFRADSGGNIYGDAELPNQFYIWGSLISENTIGGADEGICGDGSACGDAEAYDLQMMSSFVTCYPYVDGSFPPEVDDAGDLEECEGYNGSDYLLINQPDYWTTPVLIEYRPPSDELPVFNVE